MKKRFTEEPIIGFLKQAQARAAITRRPFRFSSRSRFGS